MKASLVVAFLAMLALLGANLWLTNRSVAELQRNEERITDLQARRLELEALLRAYVDAETGQRGYLLTGEERFLAPYTAARERLAAGNVRLKTLLGNEAELLALRTEIETLGERKLAEIDKRIAQYRAGDSEGAVAGVRGGDGKAMMNEIRVRAAALDAETAQDQREVYERTLGTKRRVAWVTGGSAIALALALLGLYLFTRRNVTALAMAREDAVRLLAGERAAHSEAAQANRMKDEFLALVSHELRTPLNAILGWTSLLKDGADDAKEMAEGLDTIDRNARAQSRLIADLLDVSRIISGKMRLEIREVNLRAITASVIEALRPAADAQGVRVQFLASREPAEVLGDADRLQQVVWNLLSNAIKFTPRGGQVTLGLEHAESRVALTVSDTGPGIAPDFLPHIFKRFSQGDASTTRGHGGLGLGLAITRHLVELHGGKIAAQSEGAGRGATFRVEIPIVAVQELKEHLTARADAANPMPPGPEYSTAASLDGRRVLAVDDQPDTLAVIRRVLERAGAEVRTAASAADALSILGEWRADVIVSDIGMPEQDGYSFIRTVRAQCPGAVRKVPAVALTAFAREIDRKAALDAGFTDHLAKPVDAPVLLGKVAALLAAR